MNIGRRDFLRLGMAGTVGGYLLCEPAHARQVPPYYPQSFATFKPIGQMLDDIVRNRALCARFWLDTREDHKNNWLSEEGEDHHQGLARTHRLSDGSIYFFLTHSELDRGDSGQLMQFRYGGPTIGSHVVETRRWTVASLEERIFLNEQHPSDILFLGDVNNSDSGYLFVNLQFNGQCVAVYHWARGARLRPLGSLFPGLDRPGYVFLDRAGDTYYLGIANGGEVRLYRAMADRLFPASTIGRLNLAAFVRDERVYRLPDMGGASQIKLIRDSSGGWFLLGFRSVPSDDPNGADYVDVYSIQFAPFWISDRLFSVHVVFKSGDTGFASTGTHYVEETGRLLLLSSYRWSEDEGGDFGYVSRVDECPSW
jgi:hypothetical protein